jgi:hypothetical protein
MNDLDAERDGGTLSSAILVFILDHYRKNVALIAHATANPGCIKKRKCSFDSESGSDLEAMSKKAYATPKPIVAVDAPRQGSAFARVSNCEGEQLRG